MNHRSLSVSARSFALPLLGVLGALAFACGTASPETQESTRAELGGVAPVLGTAQSFAVLGGSTVTNTNATTLNGDLGVSPGLAITGFPPGIVIGGVVHAGDAVALQAQTDVTAAYGVLASQACDVDLTGKDLGGLTLTPGVYCFSSSAQLTGALVLDAGGRADAVFVFQTVSTLITASNSSVAVINGGGACGVFWQVGSSATLGTGTAFVGSVLALTSITLATGA
jgi:type VI secretion system secreted protein VgrG